MDQCESNGDIHPGDRIFSVFSFDGTRTTGSSDTDGWHVPYFFTEGNTVEKSKDSLLCVVPTAHEERRALS